VSPREPTAIARCLWLATRPEDRARDVALIGHGLGLGG
jgi:hypothetical protein